MKSCRLKTICMSRKLLLALTIQVSSCLGNAEGDIMLTDEQQATLEAVSNLDTDPFAPQSAVVRNQRSLWPGGVVPYEFSGLNSKNYCSGHVIG
jgi:hypothetical protein